MIYSNEKKHGGELIGEVERKIRGASDVAIASGYVSDDILGQFEGDFYRIAENGGKIRLLVGMAFYEGLAGRNLRRLQNIENKLCGMKGGSGVFVCYTRKFHGKIYSFGRPNGSPDIYVGSSNFSRSGLSENLECTAKIQDKPTKKEIRNYLDYLFSSDNSVSILKADIAVFGSKEYLKRISLKTLDDLKKYDPATIDKTILQRFEYPLSRIVASEKSSLNVYFGKGRLARSTGKITPRPWYEVELIASVETTRNPLYPHGDFLAYTDDGYIIPMKASGDYSKNIRSRGNLQVLGQWIKGKLQKADALIPLTPVTQETLDKYGNDAIRLYKIKKGEYYMEF